MLVLSFGMRIPAAGILIYAEISENIDSPTRRIRPFLALSSTASKIRIPNGIFTN
jgi:hypothetical protein